MTTRLSIFLLCLTIWFSSIERVNAQGCSDAGFCTMGAMKPDQHYSKKINVKLRSLEIMGYYGTTPVTANISSITADMTLAITDKLFVQGKLPYQWVKGNLGETQGMGDISLALTRSVAIIKNGTLSATLGTKIPSNDSNIEKQNNEFLSEGSDYPMYYQVSLGSYDLILGASWINNKWLFATGIQMALTENRNDFRWGQWNGYNQGVPSVDTGDNDGVTTLPSGIAVNDYILRHPLANNLKRGTDVMIRIERNFRFTNYNFNVGVLPIYRITQDEVLNFNTGEREKVDDTTGLALSVLGGAGYSFNTNSSIKLIIGIKITDRKKNPDGLTRDQVMNIGYAYKF